MKKMIEREREISLALLVGFVTVAQKQDANQGPDTVFRCKLNCCD